ncbi:MAG TPA: ATP-binding protein [Candidatus Limnocylindria bacterium]|nr:ATP-binding protein [Candidatus Limnocylindria bacterium]
MTALELVSLLTQAIYVAIFLVVSASLLREPTRSRLNMTLFFGAITFAIAQSRLLAALGVGPVELVSDIAGVLVLAMPYFLLRLVSDFAHVPTVAKRAAEAGLVVAAATLIATQGTLAPAAVVALVAYFALVAAYCAIAFVRAARRSTGVTRRRMEAVAAGTLLLGAAIVVAGLRPLLPSGLAGVPSGLTQVLALASAVAYVAGFAPPPIIRRAWQEPELRAFLRRAASLPRLPDTPAIVRALEEGAGSTLGARAAIGLYEPSRNALLFQDPHGVLPNEVGPSRFLAWRVFETQRAEYYADATRAHPDLAGAYRGHSVASLLIAPISAGAQRLGALEAYTDHQPVFSEDDLELVRLLADQAAVILESRALIDGAARVRAHEEAARLKEDFISAAAHDLKTPLTTLVAQAQFLERRAQSDPSAPADISGLRRIVQEARRLSSLVVELLDASRIEQGRLVGEREPVDLVELAREVARRDGYRTHRVKVFADAPVVGSYDPRRIEQVLENLVENAVKYSPESSEVRIGVAQRNGQAFVDVSDEGIGIPPEDLARVFDRFHRGSNVDDRRFAGMGLGLFICRGIVEQHGGRMWVESRVGTGSTFHVELPAEPRS